MGSHVLLAQGRVRLGTRVTISARAVASRSLPRLVSTELDQTARIKGARLRRCAGDIDRVTVVTGWSVPHDLFFNQPECPRQHSTRNPPGLPARLES